MNTSAAAMVLSAALIAAAIYLRPQASPAVYVPVGDHINVRLNTVTGQMVVCRPDEPVCQVTVPAGEMKPR